MNVPCKRVHLLDCDPDRNPVCDPEHSADNFLLENITHFNCTGTILQLEYKNNLKFVKLLLSQITN